MFIKFLEDTTSRYLGQIINYMNRCIEGSLKRYILKEFEKPRISLNEYIYPNSKNKKEKIENIASNFIIDREYMSEELLGIIKNLSSLEQRFILMKYQMQYDEKEIAQRLNLEISELEELNVTILEKLRESDEIKIFVKRN